MTIVVSSPKRITPGWRPAIWTRRLHYVPAAALAATWSPSCGGGPVGRGLCGFPGYLDDTVRGGRWREFRHCRECAEALAGWATPRTMIRRDSTGN